MDHMDLDRYLAAKRGQRLATGITAIGLSIAACAGILLVLGVSPFASEAVLVGSAFGVILANSEFGLHGTIVSRITLLSIIERQINSDPDALAYIATKS